MTSLLLLNLNIDLIFTVDIFSKGILIKTFYEEYLEIFGFEYQTAFNQFQPNSGIDWTGITRNEPYIIKNYILLFACHIDIYVKSIYNGNYQATN